MDPTSSSKSNMQLQPDIPLSDLECVSLRDVRIASSVWPLDQHNLAPLKHVHPTSWTDSRLQDKYDLVVTGAGAAGLVIFSGAAGVEAQKWLLSKPIFLVGAVQIWDSCHPKLA